MDRRASKDQQTGTVMIFPKRISEKFKKTSYSQSGEDVIIKLLFDSLGIKQPSYIDIGAHHPFEINNTALFYLQGSKGINIEPNQDLYKSFLKYRKNDVNLNIGISDKTDTIDFYIMNASGLSTFSKETADKYKDEGDFLITKTVRVQVDTISNVICKYANNKFPDLLTIDAEGAEEIILNSIDYTCNYPIVICVESITFSNYGSGIKNFELIKLIESKNYLTYADTYLNTIFVRKDKWVRESL